MFDKKFETERKKIIKKNSSSKKFLDITKKFNIEASLNKYTYNFNYGGKNPDSRGITLSDLTKR